MKRIIGIIILVLVFALLIGVSCVAYGVKTALITWALGFLMIGLAIMTVLLVIRGIILVIDRIVYVVKKRQQKQKMRSKRGAE